MPALRTRIATFNPADVYSMNKTGHLYSMISDTKVAQQRIAGSKKDKTRITLALTANVNGSHKLPPFFIGHAQKPHCFNRQTGEQLGFYYQANKKPG